MRLAIASPVDYLQMKKFENHLRQVQDLRLVMIGSSEEEGTEVILSLKKRMPLVGILGALPPVKEVVKSGKQIQVILKTSENNK
jgi:hypothetical protein